MDMVRTWFGHGHGSGMVLVSFWPGMHATSKKCPNVEKTILFQPNACDEDNDLKRKLRRNCAHNIMKGKCEPLRIETTHEHALSAPNHKLQITSDFESQNPNRRNFKRIAVRKGSSHRFKSWDLWFGPFSNHTKNTPRRPSNQQRFATRDSSHNLQSQSNRVICRKAIHFEYHNQAENLKPDMRRRGR